MAGYSGAVVGVGVPGLEHAGDPRGGRDRPPRLEQLARVRER